MGSLKVMGLEKSYGIRTLFSNVNFEVMHGDKIGLVGANGSGKTTLMRILLGREESDGGRVVMDFADTVGYVEQQADPAIRSMMSCAVLFPISLHSETKRGEWSSI